MKKISIICPICQEKKKINLPRNIINKKKNLTTISIQKGLVCSHQFQIFIDNDYKIRGYQKVDFELPHDKKSQSENTKETNEDPNHLIEDLCISKNRISYTSLNNENNQNRETKSTANLNKKKQRKLNLKEIYDEFKEFIDDNNEIFREFIKYDIRKR